jgi:hypothetical protein
VIDAKVRLGRLIVRCREVRHKSAAAPAPSPARPAAVRPATASPPSPASPAPRTPAASESPQVVEDFGLPPQAVLDTVRLSRPQAESTPIGIRD